jgi:hypothetical protein
MDQLDQLPLAPATRLGRPEQFPHNDRFGSQQLYPGLMARRCHFGAAKGTLDKTVTSGPDAGPLGRWPASAVGRCAVASSPRQGPNSVVVGGVTCGDWCSMARLDRPWRG